MPEPSGRLRIGVFGGTFDPIHVGHLLIAEQAREGLGLQQVRFIPAAVSPLKLERPPTEDKHRLEMVRLATNGNPHFQVDQRELKRGGPSYTVDTLRELKAEAPDAELVLIIGSDSLAELHAWRLPEVLCQMAMVVVLARGGHPRPNLELLKPYLRPQDALANHLLDMPQIEISSSDLRRRIRERRSTRYQLHPAVEAYIDAHELYAT